MIGTQAIRTGSDIVLGGRHAVVHSVESLLDGSQIVSAPSDKLVRIWDMHWSGSNPDGPSTSRPSVVA